MNYCWKRLLPNLDKVLGTRFILSSISRLWVGRLNGIFFPYFPPPPQIALKGEVLMKGSSIPQLGKWDISERSARLLTVLITIFIRNPLKEVVCLSYHSLQLIIERNGKLDDLENDWRRIKVWMSPVRTGMRMMKEYSYFIHKRESAITWNHSKGESGGQWGIIIGENEHASLFLHAYTWFCHPYRKNCIQDNQ